MGTDTISVIINKDQILSKIQRYCAYQNRCIEEVKTKLYSWRLGKSDVESIIGQLIKENYINEQIFAEDFVRGKFRIKKWGKHKIQFELKKKNIAANLINTAISQISDDEYFEIIMYVLEKKNKELKNINAMEKYNKLLNFAFSKGFEKELIRKVIKEKKIV